MSRAAKHYTCVMYHVQVDCITPMRNHHARNVNKIMVIFSLHVCVSEGRERICQQLAFSCGYATANRFLPFKEAGES